jgi:signal transduction histidine kinase
MNTAVEVQAAVEPVTLLETLAHELRQPLSAIESTAYYLSMVLPRGERRAQEQASRLQRLTEQASWILSCALQLADTSALAPEPVDLNGLITQAVASQFAEGDSPRLCLSGDLPRVRLDPGRARWLVENLLAMTRRAGGGVHPVRVRTSRGAGPLRHVVLELSTDVLVDARGEGWEGCLGAGAAMGTESARHIMEAHGGSFEIDFDPASGLRLRTLFPES